MTFLNASRHALTMKRVGELIIAGNTAQMADRAFIAEWKAWMRFNPRTALRDGDGLFNGFAGTLSLPDWVGPAMFDPAFDVRAEKREIRSPF
jgi:hypothetical protein